VGFLAYRCPEWALEGITAVVAGTESASDDDAGRDVLVGQLVRAAIDLAATRGEPTEHSCAYGAATLAAHWLMAGHLVLAAHEAASAARAAGAEDRFWQLVLDGTPAILQG
jgi:hypothetical protein